MEPLPANEGGADAPPAAPPGAVASSSGCAAPSLHCSPPQPPAHLGAAGLAPLTPGGSAPPLPDAPSGIMQAHSAAASSCAEPAATALVSAFIAARGAFPPGPCVALAPPAPPSPAHAERPRDDRCSFDSVPSALLAVAASPPAAGGQGCAAIASHVVVLSAAHSAADPCDPCEDGDGGTSARVYVARQS